jgi:nicotinate-nucleotide pyrophosphorylase (carboxylating)
MMDERAVERIISNALEEDLGSGDITSELTVPENARASAVIKAKENCTVCGTGVAERIFSKLDPGMEISILHKDGDKVSAGEPILKMSGSARALMAGERTALNFLQRMSGISTMTRRMVDVAANPDVRILDTRKTTPGLRVLEKYAVKCGGGSNHRFGLFDAILIKDNHIRIAGLKEAVRKARASGKKVEVETSNLDEVRNALEARTDVIMLDNMDAAMAKEAVELIDGKATVEISGKVNEKNVREMAATGADCISVGSLTHSVRSVDISMDIA